MAGRKKQQPGDDLSQYGADKAYYQLTSRQVQGKRILNFLIIVICVSLMVAALSVVAIAFLSKQTTFGNVEIAGLSLEGMTEEEARQSLEDMAREFETTMVVKVLEQQVDIAAEDCMDGLNVSKILRDAKEGKKEKLDVLSYLGLNETLIRQKLLVFDANYGLSPSLTQWTVTGSAPDPKDPESSGSKELIITLGVPDYGVDTDKLYQMVLAAYRQRRFLVDMPCNAQEPDRPDLVEIYSDTCQDAVDAMIEDGTFRIIPGQDGYGFDLAQAQAALDGCEYGETLRIPFEIMHPAVTAQKLEADLYGDVLGQCQTSHKQEEDRNENLRLACEAINGMVLLPGETFSYNDALGERTEKKGYKPAASYVNGLTVDTVGGGICQVSSTLYYAALLSDMEIVCRSPHGYVSEYIDKGMDAAVSWNSQDFKFRNSFHTPIRLEAWMEDGYVNVIIHGKETRDHYVELVYEVLSSEPFETVYRELPPDNPEGYEDGDIIITPYTGYTVETYKKLYDRETGKLIRTELIGKSSYNRRDKVICLILQPTTPPAEEPLSETTPA